MAHPHKKLEDNLMTENFLGVGARPIRFNVPFRTKPQQLVQFVVERVTHVRQPTTLVWQQNPALSSLG
jgi:hypothetical protein